MNCKKPQIAFQIGTLYVAMRFLLAGEGAMPPEMYGGAAELLPVHIWSYWVVMASAFYLVGVTQDWPSVRVGSLLVHLVAMVSLAWFAFGAPNGLPIETWSTAFSFWLLWGVVCEYRRD